MELKMFSLGKPVLFKHENKTALIMPIEINSYWHDRKKQEGNYERF
jgi:hypothetical protein